MIHEPRKIDAPEAQAFVDASPGWTLEGAELVTRLRFPSYADGLGFVVALGVRAEQRAHHPTLTLGYDEVRVAWSTHDVGGLSSLDLELARDTDVLARRHGALARAASSEGRDDAR